MSFNAVGRFQWQWRNADGQQMRNTFHLVKPTDEFGNLGDLTDVAGDLVTNLKATFKGILTVNDILDALVAEQEIDPTNPTRLRFGTVVSINEAGTRAAGSTDAPAECCQVIKFVTDRLGARARGRQFLPPVHDRNQIAQENFSAGNYLTATAAYVAQLVKLTAPSGWSHFAGHLTDVDLVVYSAIARAQLATDYWFRVQSIAQPTRVHWLRKRGPR